MAGLIWGRPVRRGIRFGFNEMRGAYFTSATQIRLAASVQRYSQYDERCLIDNIAMERKSPLLAQKAREKWGTRNRRNSLRYLRQFNCNVGSRQLETDEFDQDLEPAQFALGSAAVAGSPSWSERPCPDAPHGLLGTRPLCDGGTHARGAQRTPSRRSIPARLPARHQ